MIFRDIISRLNSELKKVPDIVSLKNTFRPKHATPVGKVAQNKTMRGPIIIPPHQPHQKRRARHLAYLFIGTFSVILIIAGISLVHRGWLFESEIKQKVKNSFTLIASGMQALQAGALDEARTTFQKSADSFEKIDEQAWFAQITEKNQVSQDAALKSISAIIVMGSELSKAGSAGVDLTEHLKKTESLFMHQFTPSGLVSASRPSITMELAQAQPSIINVGQALQHAQDAARNIDESLVPTTLKNEFNFAQSALTSATTLFGNLDTHLPALLELLGDKEPHSYLVLLQNSGELRATGGFIGNIMLVEVNDGYITKSEIHDVYKFDHQLTERIEPPAEIKPVSDFLFLRDSNYSADFPLSAQRAAEFLEKENGPGVDSVIAINEQLLIDVLRITGPISVPGLSAPITAENFYPVISYMVESKANGNEDPKAIVREMFPVVLQKLFEQPKDKVGAALVQLGLKRLRSKDILFYSKNEAVEKFFQQLGGSGAFITQTKDPTDILNISHTSIGGNKTDAFIHEDVTHTTYIQDNGAIEDELTITRKNTWNNAAYRTLEKYIKPFGFKKIDPEVLSILGTDENVHLLRIYVPTGSTIISSINGNIAAHYDDELKSTYFSAVIGATPGESSSITVRYRLPYKLRFVPIDQYTLRLQKQPGQQNIVLHKKIIAGNELSIKDTFPQTNANVSESVWELNQNWESDVEIRAAISN
ncbi:DUF4012 domain-containing protein [Candidatus Gracilibacteria bacterium]|nr:DUF4012 domain-containing protein [Candidatus Gracilibacteria bacterium]